jgi:hypothetical protein
MSEQTTTVDALKFEKITMYSGKSARTFMGRWLVEPVLNSHYSVAETAAGGIVVEITCADLGCNFHSLRASIISSHNGVALTMNGKRSLPKSPTLSLSSTLWTPSLFNTQPSPGSRTHRPSELVEPFPSNQNP